MHGRCRQGGPQPDRSVAQQHLDGPAILGIQHFRPTGPVGLRHRLATRVAAAADNHPAGPAPGGQARRIAPPTPMMGGKQHVAPSGRQFQQAIQPLGFQIAGQENPPAAVGDRNDQAPRVIPAADPFPGRVQHVDSALAGVEPVARRQLLDGDTVAANRVAEVLQRGVPAVEHSGRDVDRAHGKPPQQFGHRVVMVGVGVGKEEGVEMGDAVGPEGGGDRRGAPVGRGEPAGVVEQVFAGGKLQEHALAVSHGEDGAAEHAVGGLGSPSHPAGGDPRGGQQEASAAARPQGGNRRQQGERAVPAEQPPAGWSNHPEVATRHPVGRADARLQKPERSIATPAQ